MRCYLQVEVDWCLEHARRLQLTDGHHDDSAFAAESIGAEIGMEEGTALQKGGEEGQAQVSDDISAMEKRIQLMHLQVMRQFVG